MLSDLIAGLQAVLERPGDPVLIGFAGVVIVALGGAIMMLRRPRPPVARWEEAREPQPHALVRPFQTAPDVQARAALDEDDDHDHHNGAYPSPSANELQLRARKMGMLIDKIEAARKTRVISIIHRESLESDYLVLNDLEDVLTALNATPPDKPLDIVLHTRGGLSLAAMQISRAIEAHKGRKTAFVPYYAMSAGTMIALACDEIVMAPHACLGPIDPQIGFPAVSILRVAKQKPVELISDQLLLYADISEKAMREAREHACELMQGTYSTDGSCAISDLLVSGRWTHGNPITVTEAREMGLNVKAGMPADFVDLVRVHRVSRRGGPSVAFR